MFSALIDYALKPPNPVKLRGKRIKFLLKYTTTAPIVIGYHLFRRVSRTASATRADLLSGVLNIEDYRSIKASYCIPHNDRVVGGAKYVLKSRPILLSREGF